MNAAGREARPLQWLRVALDRDGLAPEGAVQQVS